MGPSVFSFRQRDALRLDLTDRRDEALQAIDRSLSQVLRETNTKQVEGALVAVAMLRLLHQALDRLAMEDYGTCQRCHGALAFHQLTADPFATQCVACQQGRAGHGFLG